MSEMRARETGHDGFLEVMEPRMQNRGTGVTAAKSKIATMSQYSLVPLLAQGFPRKMSLAKILKSGEIPKAALINGTWPGLVPEELGTLFPIELSMIEIYNSITVLTMLPSGEPTIVPISKKNF